jgi:hypothetical protein
MRVSPVRGDVPKDEVASKVAIRLMRENQRTNRSV